MLHVVHKVTLDNGAEGLLIDIPTAEVMVYDINFRAGEYLVDESIWEAPHIMEHLLLGANEHYPSQRSFQAEFEKNGAYCNASTSVYHINYEAECADFEWQRIAEMLRLAITKPLFLEHEFQAEVGNVREELYSRSNKHLRHLSLAMRQNYGFVAKTDQQRIEIMDNVTLDHVRSHYLRTHTTKNMRFIIAGKLPEKRRKTIIAIMEGFEMPRGKTRYALPEESPTNTNSPMYLNNDSIPNMYFYVDLYLNKRLSNKNSDSLELLNTILTETLYSRILGAAREQGLVYSMGSGSHRQRSSSAWWFGAQVMPDNATALFSVILSELLRIKNGIIDTEDITIAKSYSLGRHMRSGQTVGGTAEGYAWRYFFDDEIEDYYKIPKRIEAITKDAMIATANEFYDSHTFGLGLLGSCGDEFADILSERLDPLWTKSSQ
jgi:predicted Zn-dependent peptidase